MPGDTWACPVHPRGEGPLRAGSGRARSWRTLSLPESRQTCWTPSRVNAIPLRPVQQRGNTTHSLWPRSTCHGIALAPGAPAHLAGRGVTSASAAPAPMAYRGAHGDRSRPTLPVSGVSEGGRQCRGHASALSRPEMSQQQQQRDRFNIAPGRGRDRNNIGSGAMVTLGSSKVGTHADHANPVLLCVPASTPSGPCRSPSPSATPAHAQRTKAGVKLAVPKPVNLPSLKKVGSCCRAHGCVRQWRRSGCLAPASLPGPLFKSPPASRYAGACRHHIHRPRSPRPGLGRGGGRHA